MQGMISLAQYKRLYHYRNLFAIKHTQHKITTTLLVPCKPMQPCIASITNYKFCFPLFWPWASWYIMATQSHMRPQGSSIFLFPWVCIHSKQGWLKFWTHQLNVYDQKCLFSALPVTDHCQSISAACSSDLCSERCHHWVVDQVLLLRPPTRWLLWHIVTPTTMLAWWVTIEMPVAVVHGWLSPHTAITTHGHHA